MEGAHEIQGLRFWNGNPTVQLLEADDDRGAMLLERCQPGDMLRSGIGTLVSRIGRSTSPGRDGASSPSVSR